MDDRELTIHGGAAPQVSGGNTAGGGGSSSVVGNLLADVTGDANRSAQIDSQEAMAWLHEETQAAAAAALPADVAPWALQGDHGSVAQASGTEIDFFSNAADQAVPQPPGHATTQPAHLTLPFEEEAEAAANARAAFKCIKADLESAPSFESLQVVPADNSSSQNSLLGGGLLDGEGEGEGEGESESEPEAQEEGAGGAGEPHPPLLPSAGAAAAAAIAAEETQHASQPAPPPARKRAGRHKGSCGPCARRQCFCDLKTQNNNNPTRPCTGCRGDGLTTHECWRRGPDPANPATVTGLDFFETDATTGQGQRVHVPAPEATGALALAERLAPLGRTVAEPAVAAFVAGNDPMAAATTEIRARYIPDGTAVADAAVAAFRQGVAADAKPHDIATAVKKAAKAAAIAQAEAEAEDDEEESKEERGVEETKEG